MNYVDISQINHKEIGVICTNVAIEQGHHLVGCWKHLIQWQAVVIQTMRGSSFSRNHMYIGLYCMKKNIHMYMMIQTMETVTYPIKCVIRPAFLARCWFSKKFTAWWLSPHPMKQVHFYGWWFHTIPKLSVSWDDSFQYMYIYTYCMYIYIYIIIYRKIEVMFPNHPNSGAHMNHLFLPYQSFVFPSTNQ